MSTRSKRKAASKDAAPSVEPATGANPSTASTRDESTPAPSPSAQPAKRVKSTPPPTPKPQLLFVVREVYREAWHKWGESGESAERQLVGVYSSVLEANRAAVHRFYLAASEHNLGLTDSEHCEVTCLQKGRDGAYQLEVERAYDEVQTLSVRVTKHKLDGDKSPMPQREFAEKVNALVKCHRPRGGQGTGRERSVFDDDEVKKGFSGPQQRLRPFPPADEALTGYE